MLANACESQKVVWDPLELEFEAFVSYPVWGLATELWSLQKQKLAPHYLRLLSRPITSGCQDPG